MPSRLCPDWKSFSRERGSHAVPDGIGQSITRLYDTLRSETAGWQQAYQDDLVQQRQDKVVAEGSCAKA